MTEWQFTVNIETTEARKLENHTAHTASANHSSFQTKLQARSPIDIKITNAIWYLHYCTTGKTKYVKNYIYIYKEKLFSRNKTNVTSYSK